MGIKVKVNFPNIQKISHFDRNDEQESVNQALKKNFPQYRFKPELANNTEKLKNLPIQMGQP